jgi:hypothetical protein
VFAGLVGFVLFEVVVPAGKDPGRAAFGKDDPVAPPKEVAAPVVVPDCVPDGWVVEPCPPEIEVVPRAVCDVPEFEAGFRFCVPEFEFAPVFVPIAPLGLPTSASAITLTIPLISSTEQIASIADCSRFTLFWVRFSGFKFFIALS